MREKKDLLLNKYYDLLCEQAFKMPIDKVKALYTENQINKKIDRFLDDLIARGELFYGDNFVKDFINERTDEARIYLINDLKYSNGTNNKFKVTDEKSENTNMKKNQNSSVQSTTDDISIEMPNIDEPKESITYDYLLNKLLSYGWPEEVANRFLYNEIHDEDIHRKASEALQNEKVVEDEKPLTEGEEQIAEDEKPLADGEEQMAEDEKPLIEEEEQMAEDEKPLAEEEEQMAEDDNILDDLNNIPVIDPEDVQPAEITEPMKVTTKEAKPGLITKIKEMLKDPQKRTKLIVGCVATAIATATIVLATDPSVHQFVADIYNNIFHGGIDVSNVTDATNLASGVDISNVDTSTLDTSNWNMEGLDVYDSANQAVNQSGAESANQWFSNDIQGFYDTSTGQMLDVSPADMQNADYVKDLLSSNDNISVVFGDGQVNTLNDVSGFVNGDDVTNMIEHGRSR